MKLFDLLPEVNLSLTEAKARIEHPEDMIFDEGLDGAKRAFHILSTTAHEPEYVSIKFDGCIHPDTVLQTSKGAMTIKNIIDSKDSIYVLTHNFATGKDEYHLAKYPRINSNNKSWVSISLENGSEIKVTEDHEVFVEGKGWIPAKNLQPGDDIKEYQKT